MISGDGSTVPDGEKAHVPSWPQYRLFSGECSAAFPMFSLESLTTTTLAADTTR